MLFLSPSGNPNNPGCLCRPVIQFFRRRFSIIANNDATLYHATVSALNAWLTTGATFAIETHRHRQAVQV